VTVFARLEVRVLGVVLCCVALGSVAATVGIRRAISSVVEDRLQTQLSEEAMARCASAPQRWREAVTESAWAYAYEADGTPHFPGAPSLVRMPDLRPGESWARPRRGGRPGVVVVRTRNPTCAWLQVRWKHTELSSAVRQHLWWPVATTAATATLLGLGLVVWPLRSRIHGLAAGAARLAGQGPPAGTARDPFDLLAVTLDRASAQVRSDRERLEARATRLESQLDTIAHDLKTPLSALQLNLEQLRCDSTGPLWQRLGTALDDCVYLSGLVENLRMVAVLAQDEAGPRGRCDLRAVVEAVSARERILAAHRQVAFEHAVPDEALFVDGLDAVAAERLVANLVDNAVLHGRPGGHVAVILRRGEGDFQLEVLDDGPGFEEAEARRHGRGLGLGISRRLAERAGFTLRLESRPGEGTRVRLQGPHGCSEEAP
jgi:signal transduction histidine kinase